MFHTTHLQSHSTNKKCFFKYILDVVFLKHEIAHTQVTTRKSAQLSGSMLTECQMLVMFYLFAGDTTQYTLYIYVYIYIIYKYIYSTVYTHDKQTPPEPTAHLK